MVDRLIQPVADNIDKQRTYRDMLGRHNLAMKYGFFLEAILIDYAMMEDRLRSLIFYIGGLQNRDDLSIKGKAKKYLKRMVLDYNPKGNLGIKTISGKRQIIRAVLNWEESSYSTDDDKYLKALRSDIEKLDIGGLLDTLAEIEAWCDYRNECIHSVMNKNMDSLKSGIAQKAEEGMIYGRFLDAQVKLLKGRKQTRKSLGLKN